MAVGERGAEAALSHTGSLAGADAAYRAAFDRAGIVQVEALEDLIETASFFAKAPGIPAGPGVAVLSPTGGGAVIAADKAEAQDRKSVVEGKSVSVRVYLGGRRISKKKKNEEKIQEQR